MRTAFPARAPALVLFLALALAAPAARAGDDWKVVKNESETVEITVPPGCKEVEIKNPARVIHLQYSGDPYLSTQVKVYAHQGQNALEHYVKFVAKDIGSGSPEFLDGSPSRFTAERTGSDGTVWISYCDAKIEGLYGYYVEILTPRDVFDGRRADLDRMMDSFAAHPAPEDRFTVPPRWKKVQNDLFAILGPVEEQPEGEARKGLENRLFRISSWLDAQAPHVRMLRDYTGDKRRIVARMVVHVLPTPAAFQAEAGDFWTEGAKAVYLPHHPERIVVVDGSPEANLTEFDLMGAVAPQYLETRMPPMMAWLRAGVSLYFVNAARKNCMPGVFPPELLKRTRALFQKPPTLEDLMAKDEHSLLAMGEDGALVCWGYLQYGLHGQDAPVRNMFNRFMRDLVGAGDCRGVWDRSVADYEATNKKKLKLKDLESAAKKYWKDQK
jgi:hypothetical protein